MRQRSLWLFAALVGLLSLAVAGAGGVASSAQAAEQQRPVRGGTLIFGAEQEPSDSLNVNLGCCNLAWASWITNPVIQGAFQVQPNFTYKPNLISRATVTRRPFSVTYTIKQKARWSDGRPISAADMIFTWQTYINPQNDMASRAGYEDIRRARARGQKRVTFFFRKPYAGWRDLFSGPQGIYPAHALRGEDFNKVWEREITNPKTGQPIASGPFMTQPGGYQRGSQLVLVRNPRWWNGRAYLDRIVFRFLTNTNTEIQQMRGGEVDAIYPQPQLELAELRGRAGLRVQSNAGTTWEHIDIQLGEKGNPMLRRLYVRQAIAHGINRPALVNRLFGTIKPGLPVLHNTVFLSNDPRYERHFNIWNYNPNRSRQILERNGCNRGGDGIYVCGGQRLSFRFSTTTGNQRRALAFEIIQAWMRQIGIELRADFARAAVLFGPDYLYGSNYDLIMFAFVGNPDPAGSVEIMRCGGDQNYQKYCNRNVTRLVNATRTTLDERRRARLFNDADRLMARDLPVLPLYQLPTFLAYKNRVRNMRDNPTQEGFSWNTHQWYLART